MDNALPALKAEPAKDELPAIAKALIDGDYADSFGYLGPHRKASGDFVVRSFQPGATAVTVIDRDTGAPIAKAERLHTAGLFAAEISTDGRAPRYRLRIHWPKGDQDIEDPYRFPSALGELDLHLLAEGSHFNSYEKMGAHITEIDGVRGVNFAVWAPNARRISVVGDFNAWDGRRHTMRLHPGCGVWEIFIPGLDEGVLYKFEIKARTGQVLPLKVDPYAFRCQMPPETACIVDDHAEFEWSDHAWMATRQARHATSAPMSVYEVHPGSWQRVPEEGHRKLTYLELADRLIPYVKELGFTHIELLPITEHPFDGSWGYQPIGLFAPTARYGTPDQFREFVDRCHGAGLGVILDWVPAHFPDDAHGLVQFDGTALYEHADPRQGRHRDWGTLVYNLGRVEVANYLLSNALFWLEQFHIDGLRVDAVASMLYLDYSRQPGDWIPNRYGGNENLDAIAFLRRLNELVYGRQPGAFTVAEESTAWPMVSRPTYSGGLGFGYKWNLGWMHDTLRYFSKDPIHRAYHHDDLTFGLIYAFHENFVLALSHDEVVHGKRSLIGRMPGDRWQRFANLRAYYSFMFTYPGKKLLFMGSELAQEREWDHDSSLDWHLLDDEMHRGIRDVVRDLNRLYREEPALHQRDCEGSGFEWIDCHDHENSVISYVRHGAVAEDVIVVVLNFTPVVREGYRIGVPADATYAEIFNSDSGYYGGSDVGNGGAVKAEPVAAHGRDHSLSLTLPPLGALVLKPSTDM